MYMSCHHLKIWLNSKTEFSLCTSEWLGRQPTCPVDRQRLVIHHLKPVPRILRNLLSRLDISCENSKFGCQVGGKNDPWYSDDEYEWPWFSKWFLFTFVLLNAGNCQTWSTGDPRVRMRFQPKTPGPLFAGAAWIFLVFGFHSLPSPLEIGSKDLSWYFFLSFDRVVESSSPRTNWRITTASARWGFYCSNSKIEYPRCSRSWASRNSPTPTFDAAWRCFGMPSNLFYREVKPFPPCKPIDCFLFG